MTPGAAGAPPHVRSRPAPAAVAAGLAALVLLAGGRPARASVEEFQSFEVAQIEEDDENCFDRLEMRFPDAWRTEWENAPAGFRTSEGCMTAGLWAVVHDFHSRAPLGTTSFLDVSFFQHADDGASWEWLDLDFHRSFGSAGTYGIRFRPMEDKSRQDFAALGEWGSGSSPLQVQATFTIEDAFNSLWEFRQVRVGNRGEPYRAHPYEPALRRVWRGPHHRLEASATWLTPSRKLIIDPDPALDGSFSLWGSKAFLRAERDVGPWTLEARYDGEQALSGTETYAVPGNGHEFRREWSMEGAVRRRIAAHWRAEARLFYQERAEDWDPPIAAGWFRGVDRLRAAEVDWDARPDWTVRFGLLHDRIGIEQEGTIPLTGYGTRKESRAFVGLVARFGRIRVAGIAGIELDSEPYPVTFHHDKGFLQLQTTF